MPEVSEAQTVVEDVVDLTVKPEQPEVEEAVSLEIQQPVAEEESAKMMVKKEEVSEVQDVVDLIVKPEQPEVEEAVSLEIQQPVAEEESAEMVVKKEGEAPKFVAKPEPKVVEAGQTVVFECDLTGEPTPEVQRPFCSEDRPRQLSIFSCVEFAVSLKPYYY